MEWILAANAAFGASVDFAGTDGRLAEVLAIIIGKNRTQDGARRAPSQGKRTMDQLRAIFGIRLSASARAPWIRLSASAR